MITQHWCPVCKEYWTDSKVTTFILMCPECAPHMPDLSETHRIRIPEEEEK